MATIVEYLINPQFKVREEMYKRRFPHVETIYVTDVYLDYKKDLTPVYIPKYATKEIRLKELYYRRATVKNRRKIYIHESELGAFNRQISAFRERRKKEEGKDDGNAPIR